MVEAPAAVGPTPAAVTGEAVGSRRMAAARPRLGRSVAVPGVPRAASAGVQVGPAAEVVGRQRLVVSRPVATRLPQEALKRQLGQVPGLVGRPALLGVRSRKARTRTTELGAGTPVPSGTAGGQSDAGIHRLTLGTSGLVTRLAKRPLEAGAVAEAEVALGHGIPASAVPLAGLANGLASAPSGDVVTSPLEPRVAAAVEAASGAMSSASKATAAAPRGLAPADVPAKRRGLPQPALA